MCNNHAIGKGLLYFKWEKTFILFDVCNFLIAFHTFSISVP
mgnify:CR=1 FL=1